jgi:hypothetical protein
MRVVKEPESWVVYESVDGPRSGMKSVCEDSEWETIASSKNGNVKLIKKGIVSESEAEKLARGTSGDRKKRGR